jgi:hypothetical protein
MAIASLEVTGKEFILFYFFHYFFNNIILYCLTRLLTQHLRRPGKQK